MVTTPSPHKPSIMQQRVDKEFVRACEQGNLDKVRFLINSCASIYRPNIAQQYHKAFRKACSSGQLEVVKYLATSTDVKKNGFNPPALNNSKLHALEGPCQNGHLEIVKYLLSSPELNVHCNARANESKAFCLACENGHLPIVNYMLTSPELSNKEKPHKLMHADINANQGQPLLMACRNGHLLVVKFLLSAPEILNYHAHHANVHAREGLALSWAAMFNHVDTVDYLLNYAPWKEKVETPQKYQQIFLEACKKGSLDVVKYLLNQPSHCARINIDGKLFDTLLHDKQTDILNYLVFEHQLEKTPEIEVLLSEYPYVMQLFQTRELRTTLNNNLENRAAGSRKNKI